MAVLATAADHGMNMDKELKTAALPAFLAVNRPASSFGTVMASPKAQALPSHNPAHNNNNNNNNNNNSSSTSGNKIMNSSSTSLPPTSATQSMSSSASPTVHSGASVNHISSNNSPMDRRAANLATIPPHPSSAAMMMHHQQQQQLPHHQHPQQQQQQQMALPMSFMPFLMIQTSDPMYNCPSPAMSMSLGQQPNGAPFFFQQMIPCSGNSSATSVGTPTAMYAASFADPLASPAGPLRPNRVVITRTKRRYREKDSRSWVCQLCGRSYTARSSIRYHLASHSAKEFPCPFSVCGKVFLAQTSLRRHMRTIHSHDTPPGEQELEDLNEEEDE